MAYVTRDQVLSLIAESDLNAFLDDKRTGDVGQMTARFDSTVAVAQAFVDSALAGIYAVPFAKPPALAVTATLIYFCEMVYRKRLTPDQKNPFSPQATALRKTLDSIRENGTGLDASLDRAFTPGFAVMSPVVFNASSL